MSDNTPCFVGKILQDFCSELGIKHVTTTPYYPQPSHVEKFNQNLHSALTAYHADSQASWDVNLSWLQLAFNTPTHESMADTPFEVIFTFRAGSPLLNKWQIQELLPTKVSPRDLCRKWEPGT
jgi:transposase InsO family protein